MIGIGAIILVFFQVCYFQGITICRSDDIETRYLLILLHTDESNCCNEYYVFILFMIISLFSAGMIRKNKIMKLFRGSAEAKPEPKASIISSILAVVLLSAGYVGALLSHGAMVFIMMIPVTTVVIIGTYLLYKQLSVFIIRLCKK